MRRRHLALFVLLLAACRPDTSREVVSAGDALPFIPIPPESEIISSSGSSNALQVAFHSKQTPEEVAGYYRVLLPSGGWTLENDATDDTGAIALYLTKEKRPMWIRISRTAGAPGSTVEINGAVVEGAPPAPKPADPAAPAPSGT